MIIEGNQGDEGNRGQGNKDNKDNKGKGKATDVMKAMKEIRATIRMSVIKATKVVWM